MAFVRDLWTNPTPTQHREPKEYALLDGEKANAGKLSG